MVTKNNKNHNREGRPSKLTPELLDKIVRLIEDGNYIKTACLWCGISNTTFLNWKKQGETDIKEGIGSPFQEFLLEVEQAEATSEVNLLSIVKQRLPGWQAIMRIMESRWRERWGRWEQHELGGKGDKPIEVIWRVVYDTSDKGISSSPP